MRAYSNRPRLPSLLAVGALALLVVACAGGDSGTIDDLAEAGEAFGAKAVATGGSREAPPATAPRGSSWRAGFVVVDGVYNTELMAPYDILQHTAYQPTADGGIEVITISPEGGEVRTAEGLRIVSDFAFETAPPIDILVVPSSEGSRDVDLGDERLISFVRERGDQARLVVSLCWGSFVLAHSGLLDGHAATTFPGDYDRFAQRFSDVDLRVNVSFVHDDRFLTSQGGVLSYDVAMYLVDLVFGREVAKGVGRGLLIPWPRSTAVAPPSFVSDTTFRLSAPLPR